MRSLVKFGIVFLLLGAVAAVGFVAARAYWRARNRTQYRQAEVVRGEIVSVVNSTGTVQPVLRVQVGSVVSGPIQELLVDFNAKVRKGDLMARIDPLIYTAAVARDQAALATATAEVARVRALLQQAVNDEKRAQDLRALNEDYISDTVMDQYKFNRLALEAQLQVAQASVEQAQANLENSQASRGYTEIRSPVNGIVIDRKIDQGQTVAAQFATPELFVVAPDMEREMFVYASVDEADIGLIREAQQRNEKVEFTVDAYPEDLFEGTVHQIRMNPTTEQNVVTYPVVVRAANPQMKLLPGMTADLSFHVARHADVLKIPNAALRFYPRVEQVRPEDRDVLEGTDSEDLSMEQDDDSASDTERSASEKAEAGKMQSRRHVWVLDGELLRPIEVVTGLTDSRYTELVRGRLEQGQKLVTGVKTP